MPCRFCLYDESSAPIGMQYRTNSYAQGVFDTYFFEKDLQGDIIAIYTKDGRKYTFHTARYYSEYSLHMLGWLATGWAHEKGYFIISEIAGITYHANIEKYSWDGRPEVDIPTLFILILGV